MPGFLTIENTGNFEKTKSFFKYITTDSMYEYLDSYGRTGVNALRNATPKDSGLAAESWSYEISFDRGGATIQWTNRDIESGFPVAVMIQYGHGTGTGGYVEGRDYINPAMRPVFDEISDAVWALVSGGGNQVGSGIHF
jgi:hypothetical protein